MRELMCLGFPRNTDTTTSSTNSDLPCCIPAVDLVDDPTIHAGVEVWFWAVQLERLLWVDPLEARNNQPLVGKLEEPWQPWTCWGMAEGWARLHLVALAEDAKLASMLASMQHASLALPTSAVAQAVAGPEMQHIEAGRGMEEANDAHRRCCSGALGDFHHCFLSERCPAVEMDFFVVVHCCNA